MLPKNVLTVIHVIHIMTMIPIRINIIAIYENNKLCMEPKTAMLQGVFGIIFSNAIRRIT